eukprot:s772_g28.t1
MFQGVPFNSALSACEKCCEWTWALELLQHMVKSGLVPDQITFSAAIRACDRAWRWPSVLHLLQQLTESSLKLDVVTCTSCVSACQKGGRARDVLTLLAAEDFAGLECLPLAPNRRRKSSPWHRRHRWLAMAHSGALVTVVDYTKAIRREGASGWTRAVGLFAKLQSQGLRGDLILLSTICKAVGTAAWRRSQLLLRSVQPDLILYTTAINACGQHMQWPFAVNLLQTCRETQGIEDTTATSVVATALGMDGQWQHAMHLFQGDGVSRGDLTAQNIQLSACEKGKEWRKAIFRLRRLTAADRISSNALLSACGVREKWRQALNIFRSVMSSIQRSIVSYSALLNAFETASKWKKSQDVFVNLHQKQMEMNLICCNIAMSACERGDQWKAALLHLESLDEAQLEGNAISEGSVLSTSMGWPLAMQSFETMHSATQISPASFEAVLGACQHGQQHQVICHLLLRLRRLSLRQLNCVAKLLVKAINPSISTRCGGAELDH